MSYIVAVYRKMHVATKYKPKHGPKHVFNEIQLIKNSTSTKH